MQTIWRNDNIQQQSTFDIDMMTFFVFCFLLPFDIAG